MVQEVVLNPFNIYQECNIYKMFDFDVFSLLDIIKT